MEEFMGTNAGMPQGLKYSVNSRIDWQCDYSRMSGKIFYSMSKKRLYKYQGAFPMLTTVQRGPPHRR